MVILFVCLLFSILKISHCWWEYIYSLSDAIPFRSMLDIQRPAWDPQEIATSQAYLAHYVDQNVMEKRERKRNGMVHVLWKEAELKKLRW